MSRSKKRVRPILSAFVAATALGAMAAPVSAACTADFQDPRQLYGDELSFDVYRNGNLVGEHTVRFAERGDRLVVDTRFNVEVSVLFITAYRYDYKSTEVWKGGCLESVSAVTDDDGKRSAVKAAVSTGGLSIDGPKGSATGARGLFPTNHWNAGVLASREVLNTITGEVSRVSIADLGLDMVMINGTSASARRYRYSGDLDVDVWYDADGRWVKMRFAAKDGSAIDYVCRSCRRQGSAA